MEEVVKNQRVGFSELNSQIGPALVSRQGLKTANAIAVFTVSSGYFTRNRTRVKL